MRRPRVLLAEDYEAVATQIRTLLEPEFEVVATVADGRALLAAADAVRPDVVISDIEMPGLDGIAATAALQRRSPGVPVVLITMYEDPELVRRGLAAGALGYVLKLRAPDDLVPAVFAALRGERHASSAIDDWCLGPRGSVEERAR
jgi:DNA-binding NarL/FixJ family response regulator